MQALKFLIVFALAATAWASSGSITIYNSGGYVAKFSVSYNLGGESKSESSADYSLGVSKTIVIPDGATNVYVKSEEYWFPGQLSTIFTKNYDGPVQKCFKVWGTTLNPSWAEETC